MLEPTPAATGDAHWDIFCKVIDNYGDIGVCWRLAAELGNRGIRVTLRVDDPTALAWMAPHGAPNVQITDYDAPYQAHPAAVIEAFGCEAPAAYLQHLATHHTQCTCTQQPLPVLINLEYLSAENYVQRCHKLPSLIMFGPAKGLTRWFFYPGFSQYTGGLLREQQLLQRQAHFDRHNWRSAHRIAEHAIAISLFCYEPVALPRLLDQLNAAAPNLQPHLLVTPGRAAAALQAHTTSLRFPTTFLPTRTQAEFDEMLWACDLNLVRGEDSLVRALWAGQAFVWHIYPQQDNAHHGKLNAFLDWINAPASLRTFHHAWNGLTAQQSLPAITPDLLQQWRDCTLRARHNLYNLPDLITQLQPFVAEKS